jgi:hypothetical protein
MKKPTFWSALGALIMLACLFLKNKYGSWWFYVPFLAVPAIGWFIHSQKKKQYLNNQNNSGLG